MTSGPAVSVLMPVHNGERFIGEAVESVLTQSLSDLELVVVDDGSTDASIERALAFSDPRVRIVSPGRVGISAALNAGLEACRAELVARIDCDDVMEADRLSRQTAYIQAQPGLGGAASFYWVIDEAGEVRGGRDPALTTLEDVERQIDSGGRLIFPHPTMILRRSRVLAVGGYDSRFDSSEDVEMVLRLFEAGWPVLVQPERLTRFRIHGGSVSARHIRRQFFLNEAVFGNFRRRRRGLPALPVEAYVARSRAGGLRGLATEARIASYALHRRHSVLSLQGRHGAGAAALAAAALLNPPAALRAAMRAAKRPFRRSKSSPGDPG